MTGRQVADPEQTSEGVRLSAADNRTLERELWQFIRFAEAAVSQTADRIEAEAEDPVIRRAALEWQLKLLVDMQRDLTEKEPLPMLLDLWALWVRVDDYLREGEGAELFGQWQSQAQETAGTVVREIRAVARRHIPADKQSEIVAKINAYAREHPIRAVFRHETARDFNQAEEGRSVLQRIFAAPFKAVGSVREGLDPTTRLARSVDRFTELMSDYPAIVRWQTQLLVLDLEQLEAVASVIRSLDEVAGAASRFSRAAESLPERMRQEAEALLADLDERQPELRSTLATAQETLAQAETVTQRVRETTSELTCAGDAWRETAVAVRAAVEQMQQFGTGTNESDDASLTTQPADFDIREYTRTAEAIRTATAELRQLLDDLEQFAEGDSLRRSAAQADLLAGAVLENAEGRFAGVIDHTFWRAVQLVFVIAVVVSVVRFFRRLPRSGG